LAKKTKRVEKWRAAAAQQQAQGGTRRGGASTTRAGNRPAGMARGRTSQRRSRLPLAWLIAGLAVVAIAVGVIVYAVRSNDDSAQLAAVDLTATAGALATEPPLATPVGPVDFGAVPTSPGVALANDGDVASGCWTEAQRTTDGTQPLQWSAAPAMVIDPTQTYTAELITNYGPMTWQLLPQASDVAVNNFVCLSRAGYYNGAPFHRIVDDFVIQGGDPTGTGTGGPGYTIPDAPIVGDYSIGMVTMARTGAPNSSGSQFFINTADNTSKFGPNPTYINFARVIGGQDTVAAISSVERVQGQDGAISSPTSPVILQSVTIYQGGLPIAGAATATAGTPVAGTPVLATPVSVEPPGTAIATPVA
jgi:cyclophilin family peptidyl-prolyl cis-trans isomerase